VHNPDTVQELPKIYEEVLKRLHKSYIQSKQRSDFRTRDVKYRVGDQVWKRNYVLSKAVDGFAAKLAPKSSLIWYTLWLTGMKIIWKMACI